MNLHPCTLCRHSAGPYARARCLAAARRVANAASAFSARLAPACAGPGVRALACASGGLAGRAGVGAPCSRTPHMNAGALASLRLPQRGQRAPWWHTHVHEAVGDLAVQGMPSHILSSAVAEQHVCMSLSLV